MRITLFLLLLCSLLTAKTRVVELHKEVDYGMVHLVKRSLQNLDSVDLIVFKINTFGGQLDAAFEIGDMIHASKTPTLAVVEEKAISAGALIAISCDSIVMMKGSTMGDCAPIVQTSEGIEVQGEKIQSPLRAKFRVYAEGAGYSTILAEAMVTPELEVFSLRTPDTLIYLDSVDIPYTKEAKHPEAVLKRIVKKGALLTLSDAEAQKFGFSKKSITSFDSYLSSIKKNNLEAPLSRSWSEWFVNFIGKYASILLIIGIAALYIETKAPGLGIPGAIGAVALALVFLGQHMAGLADKTEILLVILGVILLAFELFVIPGFGVVGFAGLGCIALAGVLAMQNFILPSPDMPWQQEIFNHNIFAGSLSLVGAVVVILLFFTLLFPKLNRAAPGTVCVAELPAEDVFDTKNHASVGEVGVVIKPCRPVGSILLRGESIDALAADGQFIDKGQTVVVVALQGAEAVVRIKEDEHV